MMVCEECNGKLIEPYKGYVVCENCGLVYEDNRFDYSETTKEDKKKLGKKKLNFKYETFFEYFERRRKYIYCVCNTLFGKYMSPSKVKIIADEVIKEIESENQEQRRNLHIEARFLKHASKFARKELIDIIIHENPELIEKIRKYETPKANKINYERQFMELLNEIKKEYPNVDSEKIKAMYNEYKSVFYGYMRKTTVIACLVAAEQNKENLRKYAEILKCCESSVRKLTEKLMEVINLNEVV